MRRLCQCQIRMTLLLYRANFADRNHPCSALATSGDSAGSSATGNTTFDGAYARLEKQLESFVPFTFTALTQISHTVDEELMEQVAAHGGLRSFLLGYPNLFKVSKVGGVYVARRLRALVEDPRTSVARTMHKEEQKDMHCRQMGVSSFKVSNPKEEVFRLFPPFFVPVKAVAEQLEKVARPSGVADLNGGSLGSMVKELNYCLEKHKDFIDVVRLKDIGDDGTITEHCFVRLRSALTEVARRYEATAESGRYASSSMQAYEVAEYEQYRAARLIPTIEHFVPVTEEMRREAQSLVAAERSLLHVLVSAPHIFDLCDKFGLAVRFNLDPCFRPIVNMPREAIEKQLSELMEARNKSSMRVPVNRKKKRILKRQLQFLTNPLPYFDEKVMIYALFDLLPLKGAICFSQLLSLLPTEPGNCMPSSPRRLISQYSHLFTTLDGEKELLVQRADVPVPEQRPLCEITSEEIVLSLYNSYPRRRHPSCGTCLERCMYSLPVPVRRRLRQLDIVDDVLRHHPDKVEVLGEVDKELANPQGDALSQQNYQLFRFVGVYQEDLIRRYEALCIKYGQDPDKTVRLA
ncbi:hypothetical protein TRVL_04917 [Trypanosoma vivax]|nr:hypothetical protein TRVL_04917 [Trypanosoma vivax]